MGLNLHLFERKKDVLDLLLFVYICIQKKMLEPNPNITKKVLYN